MRLLSSLKGEKKTQPFHIHLGVSNNNGIPKSSILIGFSIINHPFGDTPIFGNIHLICLFLPLKSGRKQNSRDIIFE